MTSGSHPMPKKEKIDPMTAETKLYADLLGSHLGSMVHDLRQLPEDKWDWTFAPPAPTPRILATHAWQWLVCDRQHIEEPDAAKHFFLFQTRPPTSGSSATCFSKKPNAGTQ